jgi:Spy/CpxP family protein refolding chaperone
MTALACVALADAPAKFSPGFFGAALLKQESVRKELKLSEDQSRKVEDLSQAMQKKLKETSDLALEERSKKFKELAQENDKALGDILTPEQEKRLQQIIYQQLATYGAAFTNEEIAESLKLTADQKKKIKDISEDTSRQIRDLIKPNTELDDATRQKIRALQKTAGEKMMTVLTDQQKAMWKTMQGEPFKGEIRQ